MVYGKTLIVLFGFWFSITFCLGFLFSLLAFGADGVFAFGLRLFFFGLSLRIDIRHAETGKRREA